MRAASIRPGIAAALAGWMPFCLARDELVLKAAPAMSPWIGALKALAIAAVALALTCVVLLRWRRCVDAPAAQAGARPPQLVHSRRVSQKTVLLVVRWRDRTYLLAETGQSLQVLDDIDDGDSRP